MGKKCNACVMKDYRRRVILEFLGESIFTGVMWRWLIRNVRFCTRRSLVDIWHRSRVGAGTSVPVWVSPTAIVTGSTHWRRKSAKARNRGRVRFLGPTRQLHRLGVGVGHDEDEGVVGAGLDANAGECEALVAEARCVLAALPPDMWQVRPFWPIRALSWKNKRTRLFLCTH
jgi:hypothetical protein